jgi:hypothetical protein
MGGITLEQVCVFLLDFLMPPTQALVADQSFDKIWPPSGPWIEKATEESVR